MHQPNYQLNYLPDPPWVGMCQEDYEEMVEQQLKAKEVTYENIFEDEEISDSDSKQN